MKNVSGITPKNIKLRSGTISIAFDVANITPGHTSNHTFVLSCQMRHFTQHYEREKDKNRKQFLIRT